MNALVAEISEGFKTELLNKKLTWNIQELLPANGNRELLTQVYLNLISNAIKYSAKKDKPEIEIGCQPGGEGITYYIKDNGAGFDMKYKDRLFGVFQRLHESDEFEGIGIGLATVQRIVAQHDGLVWAEGEIDKGATFYFSLPS